MPMPPRLPNIAGPGPAPPAPAYASHRQQSDPQLAHAQPTAQGSHPPPPHVAAHPSAPPPAHPSTGGPPAAYSSVPPRTWDPAHLPSPALAESSAKSFSKTASSDSAARTVAIAAVGTFAVCCVLVIGYFVSGRAHPTPSAPPELADRSASPTATQSDPPSMSAAPMKTSEAAVPSSTAAGSAEAASSSEPVPSATSSASAEKVPKHRTPKVLKPQPSAHPTGTGQPGPSDPFGCVDPVTKLRVPCH